MENGQKKLKKCQKITHSRAFSQFQGGQLFGFSPKIWGVKFFGGSTLGFLLKIAGGVLFWGVYLWGPRWVHWTGISTSWGEKPLAGSPSEGSLGFLRRGKSLRFASMWQKNVFSKVLFWLLPFQNNPQKCHTWSVYFPVAGAVSWMDWQIFDNLQSLVLAIGWASSPEERRSLLHL